MSDIGYLGSSSFDATFFRIEWAGTGMIGAILLVSLFVWFFALRELPAQLSLLVLGLGLVLGTFVPFYWNTEYSANGIAGAGRLLSAAPLSVFNGVLAAIGALPLTPAGRRPFAIAPVVGALVVWLPSFFG